MKEIYSFRSPLLKMRKCNSLIILSKASCKSISISRSLKVLSVVTMVLVALVGNVLVILSVVLNKSMR